MIPIQITDYVQRTLDLRIQQFKEKPRIAAIITALASQIQEIEAAAFQLLTQRSLFTAVGVQLDQIGNILGLARLGLSDNDYRAQLGGQILINTAQGDTERIIEIVRILTGSSFVAFHDLTPGNGEVGFDGTITQTEAIFKAKIDSAASAGVRLILVEGTLGNSFRVGTVGDADDPLRGLSDALDMGHGGKLGRAL